MKGSPFSEEQIIGILREHETGASTEEVCRRHGISSATFYNLWTAPRWQDRLSVLTEIDCNLSSIKRAPQDGVAAAALRTGTAQSCGASGRHANPDNVVNVV